MSGRAVKSEKKKAVKKKAVKKKAVPAGRARVRAKKTAKKVKKKVARKAPPAPKAGAAKGRRAKRIARPAMDPIEVTAQRVARAAYRKLLRQAGERLQAQRQSLIQAYNNTKGSTRNSSADGTEDYIDYAVSSYDRDFMLSLTEMERKQLMLVEEALQRIRRKAYGRCLQCGQEIPAPRLEVEPWARHCIRCQELEEQGLLDEGAELQTDEDELEEGQAEEVADADSAAKDDDDNEVTL